MKNLTLLLWLMVLISACSTEELEERAKVEAYFDLEGTLDTVLEDLIVQNARLEKKTVINEQTERVMLTLDSLMAWKLQLEVFYQSDINKVGLLNSYEIDTLQAFDGIQKVVYQTKKKSDFVKTMECSFRDGKLFVVRIISSDENLVYKINNELTLHFNHFKRKLALDHFSIQTKKEMIFKKQMDVQVEGEVVLP